MYINSASCNGLIKDDTTDSQLFRLETGPLSKSMPQQQRILVPTTNFVKPVYPELNSALPDNLYLLLDGYRFQFQFVSNRALRKAVYSLFVNGTLSKCNCLDFSMVQQRDIFIKATIVLEDQLALLVPLVVSTEIINVQHVDVNCSIFLRWYYFK